MAGVEAKARMRFLVDDLAVDGRAVRVDIEDGKKNPDPFLTGMDDFGLLEFHNVRDGPVSRGDLGPSRAPAHRSRKNQKMHSVKSRTRAAATEKTDARDRQQPERQRSSALRKGLHRIGNTEPRKGGQARGDG